MWPPCRHWQSVSLRPNSGGLTVSFKFHKPIVFAPEGVYLSWTVFLYRHRGDASNYEGGVRLQFQDRGKGWQPTGWTILAVVGSTNNLLSGQVHTNQANNELTTFFPGGLANLTPPFYWFATQEEYRAYLPVGSRVASRDWKVYGAVFTDCPAGVRSDPDSSPYASRLLTAGEMSRRSTVRPTRSQRLFLSELNQVRHVPKGQSRYGIGGAVIYG